MTAAHDTSTGFIKTASNCNPNVFKERSGLVGGRKVRRYHNTLRASPAELGDIMKADWLSDARKIPDEVMNYLRRIVVRAVEE